MNIFQRIRDRVLDAVGFAIGEAEMLGLRYPVRKYSERVDGYLVRGSRQDAAGLVDIKQRWLVTYIVNLCAERNELGLVSDARLNSLWLEVIDNTAPAKYQMDQFLSLMKRVRTNGLKELVYVHCEAGQGRTGTFVACYLIAFCGWTNQRALDDAEKHGLKMPDQRDFILRFKP